MNMVDRWRFGQPDATAPLVAQPGVHSGNGNSPFRHPYLLEAGPDRGRLIGGRRTFVIHGRVETVPELGAPSAFLSSTRTVDWEAVSRGVPAR
jgi:hypothetical protein